MVKGIGRIGFALCVLILLSPHGISQSGTWDDSPQLIFDQDQGMSVDSSLNISGTYIDEELPNSFTWKIFDGSDVIASGNLQEGLVVSADAQESSRNSWGFSLDLNLSFYPHCACIIEIETEDTSGQYASAQLMFFSPHPESVSHPRIILENPPEQLTGTAVLQAISRDSDGFVGLQWAISNHSDWAIPCNSHYTSEEVGDIQWSNVTSTASDNNQTLTIDSTNYEDGNYFLLVRAVNVLFQSPSSCHSIGIDNHPPTASIDGPTHSTEFAGDIQFDGSGSSDQYWGREGLSFLWVLEDEFGSKTIESGTDMRTFDMDAAQTGNYSLTLTVADGAGFSDSVVHQFNITNQAPVAALRIGGQPLADGDSITLVESSFWNIECGDSSDTANDQSGLICTWYIDGDAEMTGWERQLQKPEDLSKPHTLMLEVTDDDGASDTITVTFGVQGTPSDPMYTDDTVEWQMWIVFAAISIVAIIGGGFLYSRYSKNNSGIPKWKRE